MRSIQGTQYIVVCRGPNCRERGGMGLRKRLVQLMKHETGAQLLGYHCFGQCDRGPNVVFFPSDEWRGDLSAEDAPALVEHARSGVEAPGKILNPPPAERALHMANVAELVATVERDRARRSRARRRWRWWWPFRAV